MGVCGGLVCRLPATKCSYSLLPQDAGRPAGLHWRPRHHCSHRAGEGAGIDGWLGLCPLGRALPAKEAPCCAALLLGNTRQAFCRASRACWLHALRRPLGGTHLLACPPHADPAGWLQIRNSPSRSSRRYLCHPLLVQFARPDRRAGARPGKSACSGCSGAGSCPHSRMDTRKQCRMIQLVLAAASSVACYAAPACCRAVARLHEPAGGGGEPHSARVLAVR